MPFAMNFVSICFCLGQIWVKKKCWNAASGAVVETPRRIYRKLVRAATTITREKSLDDAACAGGGRHLRRNISSSGSARVSPVVAFTPRQARSPEVTAGWPLLSPDLKSALPEWTEMSVARWAMQLPSRCPAPSPLNPRNNSGDQATSPAITASEIPSPATDEAAEQVAQELASLRNKYSSKYTMFSYSELARMTCNFSPGKQKKLVYVCENSSSEIKIWDELS